MKRTLTLLTLTAAASTAVLGAAGTANAASPGGTGQPNASCQDFQTTQTDPLLVNGFNTAGFTKADSVYAGSDGTASLAHAQSGQAVSQYDVACYQLSQR